MKTDFDLLIVGAGFAGSLMGLIARRLGKSVVMLERGKHPRFVIGESTTPLTNLLWEELSQRYGLERLAPFSKWATWQRSYPAIGCGLKRGFTFYQHTLGKPFAADPDRRDQLLVAASPHDAVADTHWYRPDFDQFLASEAQAAGVEYLDETALTNLELSDQGVTVTAERAGRKRVLRGRFLIDASGPRGFLHRALKLPEAPFANLPPTQGLYTHFTGVRKVEELNLYSTPEPIPYPADAAALHHVFDGGWIWVLRFNNGITSAGVAATDARALEFGFAEGAPAWDRLLRALPTVREQFAGAKTTLPFIHAPRLSFRSPAVTGRRWARVPSAVGIIDPLLSTGFPLTLLGIARLAEALTEEWDSPRFTERLDAYARRTISELDSVSDLVAALYGSMRDFEMFAALSLLYFAAASFTETARRLGRPELAGSAFFLGEHPRFGPASRACIQSALRSQRQGGLSPAAKTRLIKRIYRTIAPCDVAGLSDRARRNWYPVNASDLLSATDKLGATKKELNGLLARCGFFEADHR